jgi:hypothetical protein
VAKVLACAGDRRGAGAGGRDHAGLVGRQRDRRRARRFLPEPERLTISPQQVSGFNLLQDTGKFQLLWDSFGNTPDPYSYYHDLLDSSIAAPVGHFDTLGNLGRYRNAEVDALLNAIASTPAGAAQHRDFDKIEQIFAAQLPDIPLFSEQDEVEFNGNAVTGYPTSSDPYASPDVYERPDLGWIAARLAPVKPPRRGARRG